MGALRGVPRLLAGTASSLGRGGRASLPIGGALAAAKAALSSQSGLAASAFERFAFDGRPFMLTESAAHHLCSVGDK